ncbi:MAG: hypothetical protein ACFE0P_12280 [Oceanicaulis sp.]
MSAALYALPASRAAAARTPGAPFADWVEAQARLVCAWRERLVAESGDVRLIALLDQHAAFLAEARDAL